MLNLIESFCSTLLSAPLKSMTSANQPFLLLPNDGFFLVNRAEIAFYLNREASLWLAAEPARSGAIELNDKPLSDTWPQLSAFIAKQPPWQELQEPIDGLVELSSEQIAVRLFRTDDGYGIGIIADETLSENKKSSTTEKLYKSIIDIAEDVVIVTTAEPFDRPGPIIIYANQAVLKETGYSINEVLGRSPRIFQGQDTSLETRAKFRDALNNWSSISMEIENYSKTNIPFWVNIAMAPITDDTGWYTHWVAVEHNVTAHHEIAKALNIQAHLDPVTGLPNRLSLKNSLSHVLTKYCKTSQNIAVLIADIDRFKDINENLSHRVGDLLLVELAARLRAAMRPSDMLVRMGGDEFAILIENISDSDEALAIGERLMTCLDAPWKHNSRDHHISMSIGIAIANGHEHDLSADEIIRRSEIALYHAKASGKSRIELFRPELDKNLRNSMLINQDICKAIDEGTFVLHYQPIINLADLAIVGAEVLVRMKKADGTLSPPADFIPEAEVSGLVIPMGKWILHNAIQQQQQWQRLGYKFNLSINVSPVQLRDCIFADYFLSVLAESDVSPGSITVEITEQVLIVDYDAKMAELIKLHEAGVGISLDDFGTGYSSLGWLTRFPVNTVKLDRSYTKDVGEDRAKTAIIRAIIDMSHELGFNVVAEGIETQEQRQRITELGCDHGQGYLFGKPASANSFLELVQASNLIK